MVESADRKPLAGFSAAPTPSTRHKLNNHKLRFRGVDGGFELSYQTNPLAEKPLVGAIDDRTRLTFGLFQGDASFFRRFKPEFSKGDGPQIGLSNLWAFADDPPDGKDTITVSNVVGAKDLLKVQPGVFDVKENVNGGAPAKFTAQYGHDAAVKSDFEVAKAEDATVVTAKIDLSRLPDGPYTLKSDADGAKGRSIYKSDELAAARVFGVIDIYWEGAQTSAPSEGERYFVRFERQ